MRCLQMSGAGNTFTVIDGRTLELDYPQMARELCARKGADGFMVLDTSEIADFRLHFYNADGSRGEMCGNGSRCICKFAYDSGIAGETMTVETDAGIVSGWRLSDTVYRVKLTRPTDIDLEAMPGVSYAICGVPHATVEVPDLSWDQADELRDMAQNLRFNRIFPKGTNVDFYDWVDDTTVRILSYERGVEDYTLACGTGCGALAAILYTSGQLPGKKLKALNPGGVLQVTVEAQGGLISGLLLEGPTEVIEEYNI